jgi:integrase
MACIRERRGRLVIDFYDQHGKRRWKTLKEGTTKRDARKALREIEERVEKGAYIAPRKVPSFSEVADAWLKNKEPNVRHGTYGEYKGHVDCHLKPHFGLTKISHVNYGAAEEFVRQCQEKEISLSTVRKIVITFGAIMSYAVKRRYIDSNPVREVERPKGQSEHKEDDEMQILTPLQIRALIDAAGWIPRKEGGWIELEPLAKLKYRTLFMTAVLTGMRQGELLGLRWGDFDWSSNQINVKRTFNHGNLYDPKTKSSKRKIDLAPHLVTQLKEWKLACPPNKSDLVFPNGIGKPMSATNMYYRVFLPALKKAGILRTKFHNLRHTFASLLIDQGESPKYIQTQLGHSSIQMTFDIYGHLMKNENPESATKLGNTVFGELGGSKMVAETKRRG